MADGLMDRIALISDLHGNLPALGAVFEDIERRGITRIFCLGDLVGKGPHSDHVVDLCRARCERIVRGNWDDDIASRPSPDPVGRWHQERLGPDRLSFLGTLPNTIDLVMSGCRVRLLHASPRGVYHRVHRTSPEAELAGMFASTDFTGSGFDPNVVGYGDIHVAYSRVVDRKWIFNAGSVGNPLDMPLATYAILEGIPGGAAGPFAVNQVRLPYDIERAIQDAVAEGMPALQEYAKELRTARYRGDPD